MKILPAIDIKDKKCVRLFKGDFNNQTTYDQSPFEQAKKYKDFGFNNLHIVDLDGALSKKLINISIIKKIIKELDILVEIGGGIHSLSIIQDFISSGVDKVILGSAAIKNPLFLKEACEKFTDKIALGIDVRDGKLAISGWKDQTNKRAEDFIKEVNKYSFSRLIYTDINKDGTKEGPNLEDTIKISKISTAPVIISGGISKIDDVKKIKKLNNQKIEGVIIGKAIYDGDINLEELSKLI